MAIFHLSLSIAKRNGGKRSLIAMAAYRSGERLYSELYEKHNYYNHRIVKPESFILKPAHVPDEFLNREFLWNKMELAEKQPNARLCREINVALPIELTNDDQKQLIKEYVEENFVNEGMIADVAIHRDDENNPHAHIMLTMREVDSEGNILNKRKRIPKLDEDGNQIYNEKGQRVTISVKTNNWDRSDFVSDIRKNWAEKVNQYFLERNINQQITEKSFAELGKKELPSIHEGYYSRKLEAKGIISEKRKRNLEIQHYNDVVAELEKLDVQKEHLENIRFEKTFSPFEKKELSNLSKELKLFINDENIDKRLKELKRWESSVLFNNKYEIQKQRLLLNKINDEKDKLIQAENILNKQARRFFDKVYPTLNIDKFNDNEIRAMVNETIYRKQVLDKESLAKVVYMEKLVEKQEQRNIFAKKPFQTERFLKHKISQIQNLQQQTSDEDKLAILKAKEEKLVELNQSLQSYVRDEVVKKFGDVLSKDINIIEAELLLAKSNYYQTVNFDDINGTRFSKEEYNLMLEQSKGYLNNIEIVKIPNDCQGVYFVEESMKYLNELSPLARHNLKKIINHNSYIPNDDKQEMTKEIDNRKDLQNPEDSRELNIKIFRLAKSINRLLSSNQIQKKRNLEKLIRQTNVKNQTNHISFR